MNRSVIGSFGRQVHLGEDGPENPPLTFLAISPKWLVVAKQTFPTFCVQQFRSFKASVESDLMNRTIIRGLERQVCLGENAPKCECPEKPPLSLLGPYLPNDQCCLNKFFQLLGFDKSSHFKMLWSQIELIGQSQEALEERCIQVKMPKNEVALRILVLLHGPYLPNNQSQLNKTFQLLVFGNSAHFKTLWSHIS